MSRFMMRFQAFLMFAFFIGIGVKGNPMEHCLTMMKFDEEMESLVKLAGDEQLEVVCRNMTAFFKCIDDVVEDQTGFNLRQLADLLQDTDMGKALKLMANVLDLVDELCTDGTQLHEDYLANAECYRNMDDDIQKECETQAKEAYEAFTGIESNQIAPRRSNSQEEKVKEACMVAAYQLGCLGAAIHEECGDDGFDVYKQLVSKLGLFKSGACSENVVNTIKNGYVNSLDISGSRRSLYRVVFDLMKRRK